MLKIALMKLRRIQEETSVDILPILGCGSAPFRGNFKPTNVRNCMQGYPSVYTYTLQSAFKYDYPANEVEKAVDYLNKTTPGKPIEVDEKECLAIIDKLSRAYQKQVKIIAPMINNMAAYVPSRRKRKLHIGLFGYSRSVAGLKLPRAIAFCAALYSYGLPPEILGLDALTENDVDYINHIYANFYNDLKDTLQYLNKDNLSIFPNEIRKAVDKILSITDYEENKDHKKITSIIVDDFKKKSANLISENIVRAGFVRGFLG